MNETFRPRSNFAWAGCSLVLIALFAANSFWVGTSSSQIFFEIVICFVLGGTVYLAWIKPKLVLRDDFMEIVNPLKTELIAYRDVLSLDTKWTLTIDHTKGKTRVWVAPTGGKQRWIADKKFGWYGNGIPLSEARESGMESMSESMNSASGQAAYLIRERIKRAH
jgi:hypothetical protein